MGTVANNAIDNGSSNTDSTGGSSISSNIIGIGSSIVISPTKRSEHDGYNRWRVPSGLLLRTHGGQQVELYSGIHQGSKHERARDWKAGENANGAKVGKEKAMAKADTKAEQQAEGHKQMRKHSLSYQQYALPQHHQYSHSQQFPQYPYQLPGNITCKP